MTAPATHIPVLLAEVIAALAPRDGGVYLDGTFGRGGYSEALLRSAASRVIALDRDPEAIRQGGALQALYAERLTLIGVVTPFIPRSRMKPRMVSSSFAQTTMMSATGELLIHIFAPLRR